MRKAIHDHLEETAQEIVSEYFAEITDAEDGAYDTFTTIKLLKRVGFAKYLP